MFGWLKKQQLKEQAKLIYQNSTACQLFLDEFSAGNEKIYDDVIAMYQITAVAADALTKGAQLESAQIAELLDINRTLRRLYDESPSAFFKSFDEFFEPVGGWNSYFDRVFYR